MSDLKARPCSPPDKLVSPKAEAGQPDPPNQALIDTVPDTDFKKALAEVRAEAGEGTEARMGLHHDPLTELPSRQLFQEQLQRSLALARRHQTRVAVLFLDLTQFRRINDQCGHHVGDRLLHLVARRLKSSVRESDTVARLGGDEFILALDDLRLGSDAARVAHKIIIDMARPFVIEGQPITIPCSIGYSLYPDDAVDPATLIHRADLAMYRSKQKGQNHYHRYDATLDASSPGQEVFKNRLLQAIEHNELRVVYQPQKDLRTGRLSGLEALVRWQHPELGLLSPSEFIPLAEQTELISAVDRWVLRAVCRQAKVWQQMGLIRLRVSVNLSCRHLGHRDLADTVADSLKEAGLPAEHLGVEITETHALQNLDDTIATLHRFHQLGVKVSLDDFGCGYASLSYLKYLPVHALKIDRSFVQQLPGDRTSAAITSAIINLGHKLDQEVIAEGVETEEQVEFLRAAHCDHIQGYHLSRPLSAMAVSTLLRQSK